MTKLILSTSNIIASGPSIIRRATPEKSNVELITSLRINILSAQEAAREDLAQEDGTSSTSNGKGPSRPPHSTWTAREGSVWYVPALDWTMSGLMEERSEYDITVKLFYLPGLTCPTKRAAHTKDAIALVLKELNVPSIDLLILSYPGVAFDITAEEDISGSGGCSDESTSESGSSNPEEPIAAVEDVTSMVKTWRTLEDLHTQGIIGRLGVAEFGDRRLTEFLKHVRVRPTVDQINVPDCCTVPRALIAHAKREHIELLTHTDCTNILPQGTLRELMGDGVHGAGLLTDTAHAEAGQSIVADVEPQWVVKYTAVVKNRGVVENKGYFAMADLKD